MRPTHVAVAGVIKSACWRMVGGVGESGHADLRRGIVDRGGRGDW